VKKFFGDTPEASHFGCGFAALWPSVQVPTDRQDAGVALPIFHGNLEAVSG
jgi:hypothetical protein